MIKFSHVSFSYPNQERKVLNNINFELPPGSLTLVTGASGSGKSTLLKCINGLAPHFTGGSVSGEVNIYGHDPIIVGPKGLSKIVSYVFQEPESQFVFDPLGFASTSWISAQRPLGTSLIHRSLLPNGFPPHD